MERSYPGFVEHEQDVRVNILDAGTNKVIRHDFYIRNVSTKTIHVSQTDSAYRYKNSFVKNGNDTYTASVMAGCTYFSEQGYSNYRVINSEPRLFKFELDESQVTALGYDFNSITGNEIMPEIEPFSQLPLLPEVVNIYMRKR